MCLCACEPGHSHSATLSLSPSLAARLGEILPVHARSHSLRWGWLACQRSLTERGRHTSEPVRGVARPLNSADATRAIRAESSRPRHTAGVNKSANKSGDDNNNGGGGGGDPFHLSSVCHLKPAGRPGDGCEPGADRASMCLRSAEPDRRRRRRRLSASSRARCLGEIFASDRAQDGAARATVARHVGAPVSVARGLPPAPPISGAPRPARARRAGERAVEALD
jgi:hypothetical protein